MLADNKHISTTACDGNMPAGAAATLTYNLPGLNPLQLLAAGKSAQRSLQCCYASFQLCSPYPVIAGHCIAMSARIISLCLDFRIRKERTLAPHMWAIHLCNEESAMVS